MLEANIHPYGRKQQEAFEFMGFKQDGDVCSFHWGEPLKLEDQIIYLGNNISSTENYSSVHIGKTVDHVEF